MTGRVVHVSSHLTVGSDDNDGSQDYPVLTWGRAMEVAQTGDVIAYDGMLGTMVPEPGERPGGNPFVGLMWALLFSLLLLAWLTVGVIAAVHNPVAGALILGMPVVLFFAVVCGDRR